MATKPKTSYLNVRISQDEMTYLTGLADDLGTTLSEAVRAAIARSILRDIEHGEREADEDTQWVAKHARTASASPLTDPDAAHTVGSARKREKRPAHLSPAARPRR